jgi:hypothetical protein
MKKEDAPFAPDKREAGEKSVESQSAVFTWFGPPGEPGTRYRYAVIKEEGELLSIQPGEGRFKKGLTAVRYEGEEAKEGRTYLVLKTRPNRIDLQPV